MSEVQLLPGEFKHNGRVLGLRSLRVDFTSYNNFANPRNVGDEVFAPDWDATKKCGKGLHFVPWGLGCDGQDHGSLRPVWQVVASVTNLDGKAKAGEYGCIALAFARGSRNEMRCARIGCGDGSDGLLKADTWYSLDKSGEFVEVKP